MWALFFFLIVGYYLGCGVLAAAGLLWILLPIGIAVLIWTHVKDAQQHDKS